MSNWETAKLILEYTFWISIACFFFFAVIVRVVIDYITFFSSWFSSDSEKFPLQKYMTEAISYKGKFKDRIMAKALLRMAREIDLLKEKSK
ncbi:hypothetical protein LEP1GSC034_1041 [Leptospira interrogans str. 2003000735]|uniref:Uncharacterized protein n=2 Tax=Leptospira interrogans TaxID=173 RepID=A0A829D764_LEPIR|nr:hypothetical protein [Leptospira interrogans]EMY06287.1 hypothetical protein LEP1GSC029_3178 [Leptospira interrogans str. 2002000626]EMY25581.1 hypothetical protein LEP1GSC115_1454 [Leptospira interrogans serovar Australis str. 200703203]EKN89850.1 hypothetical protein LEP1GSC027_3992 [Leptospira interrogans str. 2002000624]EKQ40179.1 hypothetical protein LEP1GSC025_2187 [Leptospira interrogans str. 2002000621]EKQ46007.1 hypothetical protein LEP1GSC026_3185 [Leptospira interrogans str. 2002